MLVSLLLAAPPSPSADISRFLKVIKAQHAYAVRVVTNDLPTATTPRLRSDATLAIRSPFWVDLDLTVAPRGARTGLHWFYDIHNASITGYDPFRNATTCQNLGSKLPAPAVLASEIGEILPDGIVQFLSPSQLGRFFDKWKPIKNWRHTTSGGLSTWTAGNAKDSVLFSFGARTGTLTRLRVLAPRNSFEWRLSYPPLSSVPALQVPPTAARLDSFRIPPVPRQFRSPDIKAAFMRCFNAYEQATRTHVSVKEETGVTQIWRDGSLATQVGPEGGWSWAHGRLTVWPKTGGVFEGTPKPGDVATILSQLGQSIQPLTRSFINDDNLANSLLPDGYKAKLVGSLKVGGATISLLEILGLAVKVNVEIGGDGYVRKIDSTAYSADGKPMAENVRQFTYSSDFRAPQPPEGIRQPLPAVKARPSAPAGYKSPATGH